jgi:hypothetical protein
MYSKEDEFIKPLFGYDTNMARVVRPCEIMPHYSSTQSEDESAAAECQLQEFESNKSRHISCFTLKLGDRYSIEYFLPSCQDKFCFDLVGPNMSIDKLMGLEPITMSTKSE